MATRIPSDLRRIQQLEAFRGCSDRDLRLLDRVGTFVDIEAGRLIDVSGYPPQLAIIVRGEIIATTTRFSSVMRPGAGFGSVVDPQASSWMLATVTPTTIFVMSQKEIAKLARTMPDLVARIRACLTVARSTELPVDGERTLDCAATAG